MSASCLATSLLIYSYLLPIFFFIHLFSLATVAFWNGQSILTVLQDVVQVEDDISLPHPPGYFDLTSNSSTQNECDDSFGSNTSIIEGSNDSILLTPRASTCDSSVIIFTSDSSNQFSDAWSEFGPEIASPHFLKDGRNALYSPALLVEDVSGTVASTMDSSAQQREPISTLAIDSSGLAGVHEVTCTIPAVIVTSVSDEHLFATSDIGLHHSTADLYEVEYDNSISSGQENLPGIPAPSWSVNPGLAAVEWHEESTPPSMISDLSSCSSASDTSEETDELDLTEEEEAILETLCIEVPDIVPTVKELAENPHVPVYVPVFSRHNVNNKVVFPTRKPTPPSPEPSQRRSSAFSENFNSMFNQVSTSWNRTKSELKRPERTHSIGSALSWKFAEIRNAKAFNRQTQEPLSTLERDPYDSWPWIRTDVEIEDESVDGYIEEEDSFGAAFKSALGYFKP